MFGPDQPFLNKLPQVFNLFSVNSLKKILTLCGIRQSQILFFHPLVLLGQCVLAIAAYIFCAVRWPDLSPPDQCGEYAQFVRCMPSWVRAKHNFFHLHDESGLGPRVLLLIQDSGRASGLEVALIWNKNQMFFEWRVDNRCLDKEVDSSMRRMLSWPRMMVCPELGCQQRCEVIRCLAFDKYL